MMALTLFDKVWNEHVVKDLDDGWVLMHIDRHLLHDLSGAPGLNDLVSRKLSLRNPELAFATPDHLVASTPGRTGQTYPVGAALWAILKQRTKDFGVRYFELGERGQGIVHVMGPELGITLPGLTVICGDSHTCTNGALGALAFGVGSSEIVHALATQTLRQQKPKNMRILFEGALAEGVTPKDLILHAIGKFGASAGIGYAVEFAGSAIREMDIEGRFTVCNLSIEMGAKYGMVAPDERTYTYVEGRPFAPSGAELDRAVAHWRKLSTDADARFDREEVIDSRTIAPTITWGTSPEHTLAIDGVVPDPASADASVRKDWESAIEYMGLTPGQAIAGTKVDWVFIGSCANSRLSDLRDAARVVRGRKVAEGVNAWVVPGSEQVKRAAEGEGLDRIFKEAGFQWREPGCSLCVAANGDRIPKGARAVSTSNRNFVGRQGPGARTHLASPAMAAAAAIAGAITDVRRMKA
jgi:3-isopropylmalate/(R)-2-methylmalate dehydratase large subunit